MYTKSKCSEQMKRSISLTFLLTLLSLTAAFSQSIYKIPSQTWGVSLDLEGFQVQKQGLSADSSRFQLLATNQKAGLTLSLFIEKAEGEGDKEACRDYYWSKAEKSPLAKENVKKWETDLLALVSHDTKKYQGQVVNFHSRNAYLVHEGYWMDVHISKAGYSQKDEKLFEQILASIAIERE
jgi:hypothetical protein